MKTAFDHQRSVFEGLLCACCKDLRELAAHSGANYHDVKALVRAHEILANRLPVERPQLGEDLQMFMD